MVDKSRTAKTPHGLWAILGLIESVLNASLETGIVESNLIIADLVQFDDEELPRVRHTTELVIVASQEVRTLLDHATENGKAPMSLARSAMRGSRLSESAERIVDSAYGDAIEANNNVFLFPLQEAETTRDARWSVRQALSLVEALISAIDLPDGMAKQMVLTRLEPYEGNQLRWLFHAIDLVIMAAALVLVEIEGMASPPGTYPLHRRRRPAPNPRSN